MTYNEVLTAARGQMGPCKACPVCDGRACRNTVPGPGAKGVGDVAIRNYSAWQNVRVNMDTICESGEPDTTLEMFGHSYRIPVFAGPVGAMQLHYGTKYTDLEYNDILVPACHDAGILAFTGDGTNPAVMVGACKAVKANAGFGIPTVKPWDAGTIAEKMALVRATGAFAVAMDIDAAGLPFLKNLNPPAGSKTVEELRGIIADAKVPLTEINEHTREVPPELLANPEVKKAVNAVEESAFTEAQLLGYEKFWDIISVEKTLYNSAIRKGMAKGMAKGIKEGMTKGIEVGRAEGIVEGIEKEKLVIARQMKVDGLPYDTISKYTGLPVEKIEKA